MFILIKINNDDDDDDDDDNDDRLSIQRVNVEPRTIQHCLEVGEGGWVAGSISDRFFQSHSFFKSETVLANLEGLNFQDLLDIILCGPIIFKLETWRL